LRANPSVLSFPWRREGWFSSFPKRVCKEIESACKVHLHDGPIADRGELGCLEIGRDPAQAGKLPACAWFPGYRQKSFKLYRLRSFVRERA